jgi:hypothetical protein
MKKVIALRGVGSKGKSTTIRKAYELLTGKYPNASVERAPGRSGIDVKVVVTIGEVKIGIEGRGDPGPALPESLDEYVEINCEIIVCTTRSYGDTVIAVKSLTTRGYEVVWFEQQNAGGSQSVQTAANQTMAERIVSEIEKSLTVAKARSATP